MKAKLVMHVWCPDKCGAVMTIAENLESMQCRTPGCRLRGKTFTVPTTEIELIEVPVDSKGAA